MKIIIVLTGLYIFVFTALTAKQIWTEKNKFGAMAVAFIAMLVLIAPYIIIKYIR